MSDIKLGIFKGDDMPSVETAWLCYEEGLQFNSRINLAETVLANENFFVGKQWEGVQANGLPTPVINILKRVVGFVIATITSDNLKVNATALANSLNTDSFEELVRIVNEECEALMEHNRVPQLVRELARNAAVDGDGCLYTYWDPTVDMGDGIMGAIRTKCIENTRVLFGDPNSRDVQSQPYIQITSREAVRTAMIRARDNGSADWEDIKPDDSYSEREQEEFHMDDKVTVVLTLFRNPEDGEIWAYESTMDCEIRKPWSLGIRKYPLVWFCWDYVQDSYHGESMVTGLIPNQIFINKATAMMMLALMRSAWPKVVYDRSRIFKYDNRVGSAIPVEGNTQGAVTIVDPPQINPQVAQFIDIVIQKTEESLGATSAALGEGKAYNTSAILSLQKAAATPNEMTKQNLYAAIEELFGIYVEFMGEYYGTRKEDLPTPPEYEEVYEFVGQQAPDEIPQDFDFEVLKTYPFLLKLDVGASSYYSEIASMQTLDNLLQSGHITIVQYLERVPDSYVPGKRKLIEEIRQEMEKQALMQQAAMMGIPVDPTMAGSMGGGEAPVPQAGVKGLPAQGETAGQPMAAQLDQEPEITGGRGYHAVARQINGQA